MPTQPTTFTRVKPGLPVGEEMVESTFMIWPTTASGLSLSRIMVGSIPWPGFVATGCFTCTKERSGEWTWMVTIIPRFFNQERADESALISLPKTGAGQTRLHSREFKSSRVSTMGQINVNLAKPVKWNCAEFDSSFEVSLAQRVAKFFPVDLEAKCSGILARHLRYYCFDNN
jgi:hypothetical protein